MSCFLSIHVPPKCVPSFPSPYESKNNLLCISGERKQLHHHPCTAKQWQLPCTGINSNAIRDSKAKFLHVAFLVGGALSAVVQPALAVTGVNYEEDLEWTLIQSAISATLYFLVVPPIILNWLRIRWCKRNLLEMYVQFMFVFIFYPGVLLWAPFLNFRKFPMDPSMKYPWSIPENPSQIKGGFLKFPWAKPEDYD